MPQTKTKYKPLEPIVRNEWYVQEWLWIGRGIPRRAGEYLKVTAPTALAALEHAAAVWHLDAADWRGPKPVHCLRVGRTLEAAR